MSRKSRPVNRPGTGGLCGRNRGYRHPHGVRAEQGVPFLRAKGWQGACGQATTLGRYRRRLNVRAPEGQNATGPTQLLLASGRPRCASVTARKRSRRVCGRDEPSAQCSRLRRPGTTPRSVRVTFDPGVHIFALPHAPGAEFDFRRREVGERLNDPVHPLTADAEELSDFGNPDKVMCHWSQH